MREQPNYDLSPADQALLDLARVVRDTGYRFVTPTPLTIARNNARPGNAWARTLVDVFGWSRAFDEAVLPARLLDLMTVDGVTPRRQRLLDTLEISPALVKTATWDVVAWNKAAAVVVTVYGKPPPNRRNILRLMSSTRASARPSMTGTALLAP